MKDKSEQPDAASGAPAPAAATTEELPAQVTLTPEQIEKLKEQASKAEEYWDRLLRLTADFDNFKKRTTRERQDLLKYANEGLLTKLVPVLDTFDIAINAANANKDAASQQSLLEGITMVQSQLKSTLTEAGLEEIDALNKPFDPNFHEAVAQKETSEVAEDSVAQQLRKGYKYRDRLVRAATVIVAKKPTA